MSVKKFTPNTVQRLVEHGTVRQYPKNQIILYDGDTISHVFYIYRGVIKMYDIDAQGNEKILGLAKEGDLFPVLPVFANDKTVETFYATITDIDVIAIPHDIFLKQLQESPDLALYCLKWFSGKVKDLVRMLSSLEKSDTRAKLHAALLLLGDQHSKKRLSGWSRVDFPVNQQFLADLVGVTRESINVAIQAAQEEQILRSPNSRVLEINMSRLHEVL